MSEIESLQTEALAAISAAAAPDALEALRVSLLGKSGRLTAQLKSLGALPPEARKSAGEAINRARDAIREALAARKAALDAALAEGGLDVIGGTGLFSLVAHLEAAAIHHHLCRHHILVRPFDYNPHWLRFGLVPDSAGDKRLAEALADRAG